MIGWFASHPAEKTNGLSISEQFGSFEKNAKETKPSLPGSVYPQEKKARFDELRVSPAEVDSRLLEFFIPEVTSIMVARDMRPQQLLVRLSELYSYHNAAIEAVESGPFDFIAVYFHFIDWVCHDFIIYSAPQRPEVSDRDFQLYRHVVDRAMNYRISYCATYYLERGQTALAYFSRIMALPVGIIAHAILLKWILYSCMAQAEGRHCDGRSGYCTWRAAEKC